MSLQEEGAHVRRRVLLFSRSLHHPPIIEGFYDWLIGHGYDCRVTADIDQAREFALDACSAGNAGEETEGNAASFRGSGEALPAREAGAVLFSNCLFKEDVSELYGLLPECVPGVAAGRLRLFALNALGNEKVAVLLRSILPIEVLDADLSLNALKIKMENAFRECEEALARPPEVRIPGESSKLDEEGKASADPIQAGKGNDAKEGRKSPRSFLSADVEKARLLGLGDVVLPGVRSGRAAFQKIDFQVQALRKNGARLSGAIQVRLCEVTDSAVSLFMAPVDAEPGDRFELRFLLDLGKDSGEPPSDCVMEWEALRKELDLPGGALFSGAFREGDFLRFFRMRDRIEARKSELEGLLRAARG